MPAENRTSDCSSLNWEEFFGKFCTCAILCLALCSSTYFLSENFGRMWYARSTPTRLLYCNSATNLI